MARGKQKVPRSKPRRRRARRGTPMDLLVAPPALATQGRVPAVGMDTHRYVRGTTPTLVTLVATDYAALFTLTLADVQGYTDFTALYDMYRITEVQHTIRVVTRGLSVVTAFVASDYDGGAAPDLNLIQQRRHLEVILTPDRPSYTFRFKPKIATVVQATSGNTAAGVASSFLDIATPTVTHFGLAYVLQGATTFNTGLQIYTNTQIVLDCRAVR